MELRVESYGTVASETVMISDIPVGKYLSCSHFVTVGNIKCTALVELSYEACENFH